MRTLKSLVLASAALLPFSATAFAADAIQEQPPVPAPVEAAPQSSWAGGYTGLYLGYGFGKTKTSPDVGADYGNVKPKGVDLGGYAGWNFQQDQFVYGVEGDAGYSFAKKTNDAGLRTKEGFEGSIRGRIGYDLNPVMPYLTAGVAGKQVKLSDELLDDSNSKFRVGWTAGAGIEAKITENILGRVEYRYSQFGNKDYDLAGNTGSSKLSTNDIRVGVGYKF